MKVRRWVCWLALYVSSTASAGQPIDLGTIGEVKVAVGSAAYRVGSAVMLRVMSKHRDSQYVFAKTALHSCDGTWLTDSVQSAVITYDHWHPAKLEELSIGKDEPVPLGVANFYNWEDPPDTYSGPIRARLPALCKAASPEPRRNLIPVSSYSPSSKAPGGSVAILTGTASRKGSTVEVWLRTTHFRREPWLIDGKPWTSEGVEQTHDVPVGTHELQRTVFDCATRRLGNTQVVEYDSDGAVVRSSEVPRAKLLLDDAIPGSVGESNLDAVCKVYGAK